MRINYNPVPQNSYFSGNKVGSQKGNNNNPPPNPTPISDLDPDVADGLKDILLKNYYNQPKPDANGSRLPK